MSENIFGKEGWTPNRLKDLTGKTYVITGANAGAGFEATKLFLRKGASVVMLNRNKQKSEAAITELKQEFGKDAKVSFILMDLAELDSVRTAAQEVKDRVPYIDAFLCNAAVAQVATQQLTSSGFESQLGINHYGHFLLLNLLFDKIENTGKRIVIMGSNGYKMGLKRLNLEDMNFDKKYNPMNAYCNSKLAQMVFAYELQHRIKEADKDVEVYVCHPGASRTSLAKDEANFMTKLIFTIMSYTPLAQSAEKGSWPEVMCATEDGLKQQAYYGPTKRMDLVGPIGECKLEPFVLNREIAIKLWDMSEELTNCKWKF
ncbi:oxidoreductase [Tenacibaculum holothuriorum]|uniref:Oxidoreductase n=1 Tax=Tenacibaculum holothuriorum TaxID=1635173 RepID=A0A1Y2PI28_9FLAO|nr:SDR family oxidoreductase [Tenacibaculum holothuriorum]OSY89328.1 oxidoreductase [Tenacibaculum holothuriorum]